MKYHTIWVTYNLKVKIYVEKKKIISHALRAWSACKWAKMWFYNIWHLLKCDFYNIRVHLMAVLRLGSLKWVINILEKITLPNTNSIWTRCLPAMSKNVLFTLQKNMAACITRKLDQKYVSILFQKENTEPEVFMIQ